MDNYLGTTLIFGGSFAPRNFGFCFGQLESISQNQALFAILGTQWGGDGRTTFGLPDLRGRTPVGWNTNFSPFHQYPIGTPFGVQDNVLSHSQLPQHNHTAALSNVVATVTTYAGTSSDDAVPTDKYWGVTPGGIGGQKTYANHSSTTMAADAVEVTITSGAVSIGTSGNSAPLDMHQPSLVMPFIICMEGLFPARN
jgi:microcystin-dependent protein